MVKKKPIPSCNLHWHSRALVIKKMNLSSFINKLQRFNRFAVWNQRSIARYSSKSEVEIPSNPLKDIYSANKQKENGVIYDKKPFKMPLKAGRSYSWCLCGQSKNQPFCDGTHKNVFLKIKLRPIKFIVPKNKEYWLCNCKQTSNRPFCDGTHMREDIQAKKR